MWSLSHTASATPSHSRTACVRCCVGCGRATGAHRTCWRVCGVWRCVFLLRVLLCSRSRKMEFTADVLDICIHLDARTYGSRCPHMHTRGHFSRFDPKSRTLAARSRTPRAGAPSPGYPPGQPSRWGVGSPSEGADGLLECLAQPVLVRVRVNIGVRARARVRTVGLWLG